MLFYVGVEGSVKKSWVSSYAAAVVVVVVGGGWWCGATPGRARVSTYTIAFTGIN
jgi:hypothetical protein